MSFERTADADDVVHVAAPRRQGLIELFFNFVQTATSPSAKVRVVGSNEYDGQEYTLAALDQEAIIPELEFGDYRLLIERGERVFLAVVFVGADNAHLRRWARRSLDEIEEEFDQTLAAWGGNMDDIVGVRSSLERHLVKAGGANSRVRRIAPQKV